MYSLYMQEINRRALLGGLAATAIELQAQEPERESLYIPKAHLVEDRKLLLDFMDEYSFVDLITTTPELRITHIPCFLDRTLGKYGTIYGHIARHNPQSATFDGRHSAVIVFRGPHSYISPTWYAKADVVPTWNFAVVHASGKLKPIAERQPLHDLLARLIKKNESYVKSDYDFAKIPDDYKFGLMTGIIGFSMEIELLEGKFKLGQERSDGDRAGVLKNLQTSARHETSLHDLTASFYQRPKPA
jgi:transcriptional regulator